jgi:hypothetical protein
MKRPKSRPVRLRVRQLLLSNGKRCVVYFYSEFCLLNQVDFCVGLRDYGRMATFPFSVLGKQECVGEVLVQDIAPDSRRCGCGDQSPSPFPSSNLELLIDPLLQEKARQIETALATENRKRSTRLQSRQAELDAIRAEQKKDEGLNKEETMKKKAEEERKRKENERDRRVKEREERILKMVRLASFYYRTDRLNLFSKAMEASKAEAKKNSLAEEAKVEVDIMGSDGRPPVNKLGRPPKNTIQVNGAAPKKKKRARGPKPKPPPQIPSLTPAPARRQPYPGQSTSSAYAAGYSHTFPVSNGGYSTTNVPYYAAATSSTHQTAYGSHTQSRYPPAPLSYPSHPTPSRPVVASPVTPGYGSTMTNGTQSYYNTPSGSNQYPNWNQYQYQQHQVPYQSQSSYSYHDPYPPPAPPPAPAPLPSTNGVAANGFIHYRSHPNPYSQTTSYQTLPPISPAVPSLQPSTFQWNTYVSNRSYPSHSNGSYGQASPTKVGSSSYTTPITIANNDVVPPGYGLSPTSSRHSYPAQSTPSQYTDIPTLEPASFAPAQQPPYYSFGSTTPSTPSSAPQ